jgi:hypothetical protein
MFHSTFPEKELKREKEVNIDEIILVPRLARRLIFDDFEN